MLGLSQQQLGQLIGVTYQQAHKYGRGLNWISAGWLFEIAQVLGVQIFWLLMGCNSAIRRWSSPPARVCTWNWPVISLPSTMNASRTP